MTSSERNGPANHDPSDGVNSSGNDHDIYDDIPDRNTQDERSQDYNNNNPVETMTNNSTIPTQQFSNTATSSHGGGARGNYCKLCDEAT